MENEGANKGGGRKVFIMKDKARAKENTYMSVERLKPKPEVSTRLTYTGYFLYYEQQIK